MPKPKLTMPIPPTDPHVLKFVIRRNLQSIFRHILTHHSPWSNPRSSPCEGWGLPWSPPLISVLAPPPRCGRPHAAAVLYEVGQCITRTGSAPTCRSSSSAPSSWSAGSSAARCSRSVSGMYLPATASLKRRTKLGKSSEAQPSSI